MATERDQKCCISIRRTDRLVEVMPSRPGSKTAWRPGFPVERLAEAVWSSRRRVVAEASTQQRTTERVIGDFVEKKTESAPRSTTRRCRSTCRCDDRIRARSNGAHGARLDGKLQSNAVRPTNESATSWRSRSTPTSTMRRTRMRERRRCLFDRRTSRFFRDVRPLIAYRVAWVLSHPCN